MPGPSMDYNEPLSCIRVPQNSRDDIQRYITEIMTTPGPTAYNVAIAMRHYDALYHLVRSFSPMPSDSRTVAMEKEITRDALLRRMQETIHDTARRIYNSHDVVYHLNFLSRVFHYLYTQGRPSPTIPMTRSQVNIFEKLYRLRDDDN